MTRSAFSSTYKEAREKFLAITKEKQGHLLSIIHPTELGAGGEQLAMDIAVFGDIHAEKTLLLVSGTHGQEGFYGSALQIEFIKHQDIPAGVNIVALHGLNPWGFSHLSRTDENNVDVNRNFTDYGFTREQDEIYPILFKALCPDDWNEETVDWLKTRDELAAKYGMQRLVTAIGGGQIVEPTGLNYVGAEASWSRRTVTHYLPAVLKHAKKVAYIDWHTGLGEFGGLSHLCLLPAQSPEYERVFDWMGESARTSFSSGLKFSGGIAPNYRGWFSEWLPSLDPEKQWAGLVIEAGTYETIMVVDAIRMDRWLKFGKGVSILSRDEMRSTMIERLYPSSDEWRDLAMKNGLHAQSQALKGLQDW